MLQMAQDMGEPCRRRGGAGATEIVGPPADWPHAQRSPARPVSHRARGGRRRRPDRAEDLIVAADRRTTAWATPGAGRSTRRRRRPGGALGASAACWGLSGHARRLRPGPHRRPRSTPASAPSPPSGSRPTCSRSTPRSQPPGPAIVEAKEGRVLRPLLQPAEGPVRDLPTTDETDTCCASSRAPTSSPSNAPASSGPLPRAAGRHRPPPGVGPEQLRIRSSPAPVPRGSPRSSSAPTSTSRARPRRCT